MADNRNGKKRNGGKVVGTIGGVGVVGVLLLYLLGGKGAGFGGGGFGFLPGSGTGSGSGDASIEASASGDASSAASASESVSSESVSSESVSSESSEVSSETSESESAGNTEEGIPDVIVVRIIEDKVTINGEEVKDADALKEKIKEYNTDGRTFELMETRAILETYNWVKACFEEMEVFLSEQ
ncbi:MAG: hypothetical protein IIY46_08260 [Lachnospiraceae bacterium]|nr:hypothetical protein [Lachnospiraceae bacterium]